MLFLFPFLSICMLWDENNLEPDLQKLKQRGKFTYITEKFGVWQLHGPFSGSVMPRIGTLLILLLHYPHNIYESSLLVFGK